LRDLVISVLHRLRQSRTLHTLTFRPISGVHFTSRNLTQIWQLGDRRLPPTLFKKSKGDKWLFQNQENSRSAYQFVPHLSVVTIPFGPRRIRRFWKVPLTLHWPVVLPGEP
jgi:hypothetical protein